MRRLIPLLTLALIAATAVTAASARNPGGRNFPGATFSAGVSGDDSVPTSTAAAPVSPLGALVRVSDDVSSTVGPTPPGQSGQVFLSRRSSPGWS